MQTTVLDAPSVPPTTGGYAAAVDLADFSRLLFLSGQIPVAADGTVPDSFEDQCRLTWRHVTALLDAGGLDVTHLVKVTTYLSDRRHAETNSAVRREVLGTHRPALTVVVTEIYDPAWLLEIEAVAAT